MIRHWLGRQSNNLQCRYDGTTSTMTKTITWLHISDLHARLSSEWDAKQITSALVKDLKRLNEELSHRPDFIFFTGDIAFGATATEVMSEQYAIVKNFLDAVRNAYSPPIPKRNIYLVPGNHDIDRNEITSGELEWLRSSKRTLEEVRHEMQRNSKQWRSWMDRFGSYRSFLRSYGLDHLQPESHHLCWADAQDVGGIRIGIVGLNSAWSAADDNDKGRLWGALDYQIAKMTQEIGETRFNFALIHHPSNWFTVHEDPSAFRAMRRSFPIILHGHEHNDWVQVDEDKKLIVSAAACYQSSWMANGYNIGHINLDTNTGSILLRQWDATGGGWVPREIAKKTHAGQLTINGIDWIGTIDETIAKGNAQGGSNSDDSGKNLVHYTNVFCKYTCNKFGFLELFGCDIPRALQSHNHLSVAYVSLNLTSKNVSLKKPPLSDQPMTATANAAETAALDEHKIAQRSLGGVSLEYLLDSAPGLGQRLTILGNAGAGKSTLLRWCATRAADYILQNGTSHLDFDGGDDVIASGSPKSDVRQNRFHAWRKIPFLIRLRDCADGEIPPVNEWPSVLAKHEQAAPREWIHNILSSGLGLILLDGVDEIHRDNRPQAAQEIAELVGKYPECTYIVTTRPGAVESGWLDQLDFSEALLEPMGKRDRDELIDKWYKSAELVLARLQTGEDLMSTAARLKSELAEHSELTLLASNPLLCAMICALYRERQERLPETPSDLCEALVHMLAHRRERETPGLGDRHFLAGWRDLQYGQKKGLLSDLAWSMVNSGDSFIDQSDALRIFGDALENTPGRNRGEAEDVLLATIERSGLLRSDGDGKIDFLHNTIKEYLAASRLLETSDLGGLVAHADDPFWQPVILFALSLGTEQFCSGLIRLLLSKLPHANARTRRPGALSKVEKEKLAQSNVRAFFIVRCKKAARRLSADLSTAVDELTRQLLPPTHMQDVEALAQLGPKLLAQSGDSLGAPKWWVKQDVRTAVRCLRLLRLIGGGRAKTYLSSIQRLPDSSSQLMAEWMLSNSELAAGTLPWPFLNKTHVAIDGTHVSDLSPLAKLNGLMYLSVRGTRLDDLSPIAGLRNLRSVDVSWTAVSDLTPLNQNRNLAHLYISSSAVENIEVLRSIQSLTFFSAYQSKIRDLGPLSLHSALKHLDLERTQITDLDPIKSLVALEELDLKGLQLSDIGPLSSLSSLRRLVLAATRVDDLSALAGAKSLEQLYLSGCPVSDISPLGGEDRALKILDLSKTKISSIAALSSLGNLAVLNISGTSVQDILPLQKCVSLANLTMANVKLRDHTVFTNLSNIVMLNINNSSIVDLNFLRHMPKISSLSMRGCEIADFEPLFSCRNLVNLQVSKKYFPGDIINRLKSELRTLRVSAV